METSTKNHVEITDSPQKQTTSREASSRVPITIRDFFFHDPYFESYWPTYERIHQDMLRDSQDLWSRMGSVERYPEVSAMIFPRRWMFPKYFAKDNSDASLPLDVYPFHHGNEDLVHVIEDETKLEVSIDLHDYKPEEVKISVVEDMLIMEAKHEEDDEDQYVSRQFKRKLKLPEWCEAETVHSSMSSDGILVVTAPKIVFEVDQKAHL